MNVERLSFRDFLGLGAINAGQAMLKNRKQRKKLFPHILFFGSCNPLVEVPSLKPEIIARCQTSTCMVQACAEQLQKYTVVLEK